MPGAFSSRTHLLFDLDGTLVDSSDCHARAYVGALRARHPRVADAFDYTEHLGRPTREVFRGLGFTDPDITELTATKQALYRSAIAAGHIRLFPGVRRLLEQLRKAGKASVLVTGASRRSTSSVLAGFGLSDYFIDVVAAEDAPRGKPCPDPYRQAVKRNGLAERDCLAVEDAANGVESARAAGVDVVLVHSRVRIEGVMNVGTIDALASLVLA